MIKAQIVSLHDTVIMEICIISKQTYIDENKNSKCNKPI